MSGKRYKKGLFIGRFQPFHHGHKYAIEHVHTQCDELIIGVGSSKESNTDANPLDFETRVEIVKAGLENSKVDMSKVKFVEVPDFKSDEEWFRYIKERHGDIDAVFSGNSWVQGIFKDRGIEVVEPPMYRRDEISGTQIRNNIRSGETWTDLVPDTVVGLIEKSKGKIKNAS